MKKHFVTATFTLLLQMLVLKAQTTIEDSTSVIEVIGLQYRSVEQFQQHIKRHDSTFNLRTCSALLERTGFPEVSLMMLPRHPTLNKRYTVLTVIEPENSAYIRRAATFEGKQNLPAEWRSIKQAINWENANMMNVLMFSLTDSSIVRALPPTMPVETFAAVRSRILAATVEVGLMADIARHHAHPEYRATALLALAAAPTSDTVWYAAIAALRDVVDANGALAKELVHSLLPRRPESLRWKPAYNDLRFLVNGSGLSNYGTVIRMFAALGLTETDFNEIFTTAHSRQLLLSHLRAKHNAYVYPALVQMMEHLYKGFNTMDAAAQENLLLGSHRKNVRATMIERKK